MSFTEVPPPPPKQDVPLVMRDGTIHPDWHRWLLLFIEWTKRMAAAIT